MLEILGWTLVGLYVVGAFYTLAENLTGRHVLVRDTGAKLRAVLEAAGWPLAVLPWRELLSYWWRTWNALPLRYQEMGA